MNHNDIPYIDKLYGMCKITSTLFRTFLNNSDLKLNFKKIIMTSLELSSEILNLCKFFRHKLVMCFPLI